MLSVAPTLAGRGEDLAALDGCLARAVTGRAQLVVVEGEPGMGKSTLIDAFLQSHPEVRVSVRIRCDPSEQHLAFGVAGLLLGQWLTETSDVHVGRELLSWFSDAQTGDDTVVVVIDDAPWLDAPSLRALRLALMRLRADAVLTLVALRPLDVADPGQELNAQDGGHTALRLRPLAATAVQQLTMATRGWWLSGSAAEHLVSRTGGLPLLVHALLRDAASADDLTDAVPASATTAAQRMLASIDESARLLVEAAAVLAVPTDLVALGQVAEVDDPSFAVAEQALRSRAA